MSFRVPSFDRKRDELMKRYEKSLAYFESVPEGKREEIHADETEYDLRLLIAELRAHKGIYRG